LLIDHKSGKSENSSTPRFWLHNDGIAEEEKWGESCHPSSSVMGPGKVNDFAVGPNCHVKTAQRIHVEKKHLVGEIKGLLLADRLLKRKRLGKDRKHA